MSYKFVISHKVKIFQKVKEKTKKMKRITSILLCVIMLMTTLSLSVVTASASTTKALSVDAYTSEKNIAVSVTPYNGKVSYYRFYYRIQKNNGSWTSWCKYDIKPNSLEKENGKIKYNIRLNELSPYMSIYDLSSKYKIYDEKGVKLQYDVRAIYRDNFVSGSYDRDIYWLPNPDVDSVDIVKIDEDGKESPDGNWYMPIYAEESYYNGKHFKGYRVFVKDSKNNWRDISSSIVKGIKIGNNKYPCVIDLKKANLSKYISNGNFIFTIRGWNGSSNTSCYYDNCFTVSNGLKNILTSSKTNAKDAGIKISINNVNNDTYPVKYLRYIEDALDWVNGVKNIKEVSKSKAHVCVYIDTKNNNMPVIKFLASDNLSRKYIVNKQFVMDLNGYTLDLNAKNHLILYSPAVIKNGSIYANKIGDGATECIYAISNLDLRNLTANIKVGDDDGVTFALCSGKEFYANECTVTVSGGSNINHSTSSKYVLFRGFYAKYCKLAQFNNIKMDINGHMDATCLYNYRSNITYVDGCDISINKIYCWEDTGIVQSSAFNSNIKAGQKSYVGLKKPNTLFGGNAALYPGGEGTHYIYDGLYHDFEHGGVYVTGSGTINVNGGKFISTPKEDSRAEGYQEGKKADGSYKVTRHGAFYVSGGNSTINIKNAYIEGGSCGIRVRDPEGSGKNIFNIENTTIIGQTNGIAPDTGTFNIGKNVDIKYNENINSYGDASGHKYYSGYAYSHPDKVKINEYNPSTDKTEKKALTPEYPVVTSITGGTNGQATISWKSYPQAYSYRVYMKTESGWKRIANIANDGSVQMSDDFGNGKVASSGVLSFCDKTVKNGETRIYTIRALDENGDFCSGYKKEGWSYISYPVISKISNSSAGAKITFEKYRASAWTRIFYKDSNNNWKSLGDTKNKISFIDDTIKPGEKRIYTLRAMDTNKNYISWYNETGWSFTKK